MTKITEARNAQVSTGLAITLTAVAILAAAVTVVALVIIFAPGVAILGLTAGAVTYGIVAGSGALSLGAAAGATALFIKAHGHRKKISANVQSLPHKVSVVKVQTPPSFTITGSSSQLVASPSGNAQDLKNAQKKQANQDECIAELNKHLANGHINSAEFNRLKGRINNEISHDVAGKDSLIQEIQTLAQNNQVEALLRAQKKQDNQDECNEILTKYHSKGYINQLQYNEAKSAIDQVISHDDAVKSGFIQEMQTFAHKNYATTQLDKFKDLLGNEEYKRLLNEIDGLDHKEENVKTFLSHIKDTFIQSQKTADSERDAAFLALNEHQNKMALFAFTVYPNKAGEDFQGAIQKFEKMSYEEAKKKVLDILDKEFASDQQILTDVKIYIARDKLKPEQAYPLAAELWKNGSSRSGTYTPEAHRSTWFKDIKTLQSEYRNYMEIAKQCFMQKKNDLESNQILANKNFNCYNDMIELLKIEENKWDQSPTVVATASSTDTVVAAPGHSEVSSDHDSDNPPINVVSSTNINDTDNDPDNIPVNSVSTVSAPPAPKSKPIGKITIEENKFSFSEMDSTRSQTVENELVSILSRFFDKKLAQDTAKKLVNAIFAPNGLTIASKSTKAPTGPSKPSLLMPMLRLIFPVFKKTKETFEENKYSLFAPAQRDAAIKEIGQSLKKILTSQDEAGAELRKTLTETSREQPKLLSSLGEKLSFAGIFISDQNLPGILTTFFPIDSLFANFDKIGAQFFAPLVPLVKDLVSRVVPIIGIKGVQELLGLVESYFAMAQKGCDTKDVNIFIMNVEKFMKMIFEKIDASKEKELFVQLWNVVENFIVNEENKVNDLLAKDEAEVKAGLKGIVTQSVGKVFAKVGLASEIVI